MEIGVGDLLAAADVVEDDHSIVVEVDAVYEHVDHTPAKGRILGIPGTEFFQPGEHFYLGEPDLLGDAELGELGFNIVLLRLQSGHAVVDLLPGHLRRLGESIDQLIQLPVDLLKGLFQLRGAAVGKLPVVLRDNGFRYPPGAGGREYISYGLLDYILLDILLALVLFPAGVLFLFIRAGVVIVCAAVFGPAALAHHRRPAMPAKGFSLELVIHPGLFRSGGTGHGFEPVLHTVKSFLVDQRLSQAGDDLAFIPALTNIDRIGIDVLESGVGQRRAFAVAVAAAVELVHDLLFGGAGGILRENVPDDGRGLLVDDQLSVDGLVSVGDRAAEKQALCHALPLAAADVL